MNILRNEYPRPDYVREKWQTLNGSWDFAFDDDDRGLVERWHEGRLRDRGAEEIIVPFAYQSALSGVHDKEVHPVLWYQREFSLDESWANQSVLLNFGAVDYFSTVWVNGALVGQNKGGYIAFSFDITKYLVEGVNTLTLRVEDNPVTSQPRGKQLAKYNNFGCWYTPISGIWQSVWFEAAGETYLDHVRLQPNIEQDLVVVDYWLNQHQRNLSLECAVYLEDQLVSSHVLPLEERYNWQSDIIARRDGKFTVTVPDAQLWSPENPVLYDLVFQLKKDGQTIDKVRTYVGMRKIAVENGKVYLNNEPYFLRMVLDQGYWPEGIYTAKSIAELEFDVEMTKKFGFNAARKHQKFEDPYYYYYCDKLGLLTWCEMAACYHYDEEVSKNITDEWQRLVIRHYNHPSVMAWVPINESWGVEQLSNRQPDPRLVSHLQTMYHLTKSLDPTRLVIGNDGWQMAKTDIIAIHEYTQDAEDFKRRYAQFKADPYSKAFSHDRPIMLPGFAIEDQPIMVTEFGGVKIQDGNVGSWGYGHDAKDVEDMLARVEALVSAILEQPEVAGYCYTQLTDVQQEVNGLLTFDRKPKADPERFAKIFV